jgi:UDP-GlcNAc:undecaprenyl-phosphate GlcNAc-1-phosphate transferase
MISSYLPAVFIALFLSALLTAIIAKIASWAGIVDKPDKIRKFHEKATPLLGGTAIFFAFFLTLSLFFPRLIAGDLDANHWVGFFLSSLVLIIGGYLDDRFNLSPKAQLIFPLVAILLLLLFGINIEKISNPFGQGYIYLDSIRLPIFSLFGQQLTIVLLSDLLISFWLLGMMYTTKLLDGMDGLVGGVTMIGSVIIFLFTITERYFQPDIALASAVLAAACFGFLIFNWHPAKIFLGEGASLFLGFALGVLAIISGGKFAIALLVMGIPILDVVWTIVRRLRQGKNPFRFSDRGHLHFRLLDSGLSVRQTVLLYYLIALSFGLSALFLQSFGKLMAFLMLSLIMLILISVFNFRDKLNIPKQNDSH